MVLATGCSISGRKHKILPTIATGCIFIPERKEIKND
jgi:hypothetical protein